MTAQENRLEAFRQAVLEAGAYRAAYVNADEIVTDAGFRKMCEANTCGNYGKSYMCPPDVGEIETLMAELHTWNKALVYQTVGELEDSYDFEGMMEAGAAHNTLMRAVRSLAEQEGFSPVLHLGAGGCRMCQVCAKKTGEPCRHPEQALASLEAYGVYVSLLAELAGMKYINGTNTVTYFGAMFWDKKGE